MLGRCVAFALVISMDVQAASCPSFPVGVVRAGEIFHATAVVEALRESKDSIELAIAEASLASRMVLQREGSTPKDPDGHLQGVTQVTCVVGRKAYVTSSVSRASSAQAARLKTMLNQSQRVAPTPPLMHHMGR